MIRLLITLLAAGTLCVAHAAPEIQPGSWSVTTSTSMPGMKTPPMTVTHCVTPAEARLPADTMANMGEQMKQQQCRMLDQKISASTVSFRMQCSGQLKMTAEGNYTFTPRSYEGTMVMVADGGMKISSEISGKYLGACKP